MKQSDTPCLKFFFKVVLVWLQRKVTISEEVGRGSYKETNKSAPGTATENARSATGSHLGRRCGRLERTRGERQIELGLKPASTSYQKYEPRQVFNFLRCSLHSCKNGWIMPACAGVGGAERVLGGRYARRRCLASREGHVSYAALFLYLSFHNYGSDSRAKDIQLRDDASKCVSGKRKPHGSVQDSREWVNEDSSQLDGSRAGLRASPPPLCEVM